MRIGESPLNIFVFNWIESGNKSDQAAVRRCPRR